MITIKEVVEELIKNEPYLEEAISLGIINYSALARKLRPEIENKLLKTIETGAIIMALKRASVSLVESKTKLNGEFRKNVDMIVRSNLIEYTISNSQTILKKIIQLLNRNSDETKHFLTITQGVFETAIIISSDWDSEFSKILKEEKLEGKLTNLSSITLKLPKENVFTPGVYYFILKALAWENINLIDVVSTSNEFTVVLDNKEVDRAFSILKRLF